MRVPRYENTLGDVDFKSRKRLPRPLLVGLWYRGCVRSALVEVSAAGSNLLLASNQGRLGNLSHRHWVTQYMSWASIRLDIHGGCLYLPLKWSEPCVGPQECGIIGVLHNIGVSDHWSLVCQL